MVLVLVSLKLIVGFVVGKSLYRSFSIAKQQLMGVGVHAYIVCLNMRMIELSWAKRYRFVSQFGHFCSLNSAEALIKIIHFCKL